MKRQEHANAQPGYSTDRRDADPVRRVFLLAGAIAPLGTLLPREAHARGLRPGSVVALRCLGDVEGARWLDGRTANGTAGLAPRAEPPFSGTRWEVVDAGRDAVSLRCLGDIEGARWLDGRTGDGSVGLAPNNQPPFTGTRWEVIDAGREAVFLRCLGDREGNRWLDGRTANGTVGLAPTNQPPFSGTRWEVVRVGRR